MRALIGKDTGFIPKVKQDIKGSSSASICYVYNIFVPQEAKNHKQGILGRLKYTE